MNGPNEHWIGQPLLDRDGQLIGTVAELYVDREDGSPAWMEVEGAAPGRAVLVPAWNASVGPQGVWVEHSAHTVASAPDVPAEGLTLAAEQRLEEHYAVGGSMVGQEAPPAAFSELPSLGHTAPFDADRLADDVTQVMPSVVRAEEELELDTVVEPVGTVRLRKWVETETVAGEISLHRERIRVEREPLDLRNVDEAVANAQIGEAELEIVLHDEQVVASKITVPKEVVRLTKDIVVDDVVVEADLRREQVVVEDEVVGR